MIPLTIGRRIILVASVAGFAIYFGSTHTPRTPVFGRLNSPQVGALYFDHAGIKGRRIGIRLVSEAR
jgi:hypothetical protein